MNIYPKRYYGEPKKRAAYIEAFDLISIYGAERHHWNYKALHLCRKEMKEIWALAEKDAQGKSVIDFIYERKTRR